MRELVFVDVETTHLSEKIGQVWEIAWAFEDGPVRSAIVPHTLDGADPVALDVGRYHERGGSRGIIERLYGKSIQFESQLKSALKGELADTRSADRRRISSTPYTFAGANPAFDFRHLQERWGSVPCHHRLLDVEAYAMAVFGWDELKGLKEICTELGIEPGDHTAAGDVSAVREAYIMLRNIAQGREPEIDIQGMSGSSWRVFIGSENRIVSSIMNASTKDRVDTVWARFVRGVCHELGVAYGTPAAAPVAPMLGFGKTRLADYLIPAGTQSTTSARRISPVYKPRSTG